MARDNQDNADLLPGMSLWKVAERRRRGGRKPRFGTPEEVWDAARRYFEWVEANPLYETKVFNYKGETTKEQVPKMRAMTLRGFMLHAGLCKQTWANMREREDFREVTALVDECIREQKFVGAAADLLNAVIISRDLGLADKRELTGADGEPLVPGVVLLPPKDEGADGG